MKTLKDLFEVYKPKSPDEQKFVDKHVTIKHKDRNGNGDDVFNATNLKTIKRKEDRHGYDVGDDEKVYEALKGNQHKIDANKNGKVDAHDFHLLRKGKKVAEATEMQEAMDAADRFDHHHQNAKNLLKSINQHLKNHATEAMAYKDSKGRKGPNWSHTGSMEHIANQLSNLHDQLARTGEYSVYEEVELGEKTLTAAELKKREEVAKAMERDNPGMDMSKKMAIATATAKRVAEDTEELGEMSSKMKMKLGLYGKKKMKKEDVINNAIDKFMPELEDYKPMTQEEKLVAKLDDISEAHIHLLLNLFDSLNEENKVKMLGSVDTREEINSLIDFALNNRGD